MSIFLKTTWIRNAGWKALELCEPLFVFSKNRDSKRPARLFLETWDRNCSGSWRQKNLSVPDTDRQTSCCSTVVVVVLHRSWNTAHLCLGKTAWHWNTAHSFADLSEDSSSIKLNFCSLTWFIVDSCYLCTSHFKMQLNSSICFGVHWSMWVMLEIRI